MGAPPSTLQAIQVGFCPTKSMIAEASAAWRCPPGACHQKLKRFRNPCLALGAWRCPTHLLCKHFRWAFAQKKEHDSWRGARVRSLQSLLTRGCRAPAVSECPNLVHPSPLQIPFIVSVFLHFFDPCADPHARRNRCKAMQAPPALPGVGQGR